MKTLISMLVLCPFCLVSPIQDGSTATIAVQEHLRPVPGDTPEPLFASTISARAREANLGSLRRKDLHGDGSELRVWVGFGKKPPEGFIINRSGEHWEATFLESINRTTHPPYQKRLTEPRSGWKQLWSRLVAEGILSLPDHSQLKGERLVKDGTSYVVEVKEENTYRTYAYLNPDYQKSSEAEQILKVADILYAEFGINR